MSLLHYLKKNTSSVLPSHGGALSRLMPPSSVASGSKRVLDVSDSPGRGKYSVYTEEEKFKVAKRAAEMGINNTIRHFQKEFDEHPLKESTVRTSMNKYKKELAEKRKCGNDKRNEKAT